MTKIRLASVPLLLCLLAAACGGKSPSAPSDSTSAAPDPSTPVPASGGGTATIAGTLIAPGASIVASALSVGIPNVTVTIAGTSLSTTSDGSGRFILTTVPGGDQQLQFDDHGRESRVLIPGIGEREDIKVTVSLSGASAEVTDQERTNGAQAEVEGRIASIDVASRTIVVRSVTVRVPDGTTIRKGNEDVSLNVLQPGDRVHVRGTKGDAGITASEVLVQQSEATDVELSGTISDMAGACPDVRFRFGSTSIVVNTATSFAHGACSDISNGRLAEIKGVRRADGSVLATHLHFDDQPGPPGGEKETSARGEVSNVSGQCPSLRFVVSGKTVTTTSSTTFAKGTCNGVKSGAIVEVEGTVTSDALVARKVQFEDTAGHDLAVKGKVAGLSGTCPALAFTVQDTNIVTTSSTMFEKAGCPAIANGRSVEVEGTKDGSVLTATKVSIEDAK